MTMVRRKKQQQLTQVLSLESVMANYKIIEEINRKICEINVNGIPFELHEPYLAIVELIADFGLAYLNNVVPREQYPKLAKEIVERKFYGNLPDLINRIPVDYEEE